MVYERGDYRISIDKVEGFGETPSLWVHRAKENEATKVASFGSDNSAYLFEAFMEWFMNGKPIRDSEFDFIEKNFSDNK